MTKEQKQSNFDRLIKRSQRYVSESRLLLIRNLSLGGAAASLAILLHILLDEAIKPLDSALRAAVFAGAIAIPLWLLTASLLEGYIFLGAQSFRHFRKSGSSVVAGVWGLAGLCLLGQIVAVLIHLDPEAAVAFGVATVVSIVGYMVFHAIIAQWWYSADGPGEREESDRH